MKKELDLTKLPIEEFDNLPELTREVACDGLVILPTSAIKEGFRLMKFALIIDYIPAYSLSTGSENIYLEGIGGYGKAWSDKHKPGKVPSCVPPSNFIIDCLATSGLMRIWALNKKILCRPVEQAFNEYLYSSSFEIFIITE